MKTMSSKSQISYEFLIAVSFLVLLLLVYLLFYLQRQAGVAEEKDYFEKKTECVRISALISDVYLSGDGTSARTFSNYNLTASNGLMKMEDVSCSIFTNISVSGLKGNIVIKNLGGQVSIV